MPYKKIGKKALVFFILKYSIAFFAFSFVLILFLASADTPDVLFIFTFLGGPLLGFIWGWLTYQNYVYKYENNAFLIQKGVLNQKQILIPYSNIQNIDINRSISDRLLGLAHLKIQTASDTKGYEGELPYVDVKDAEMIRNKLLGKMPGKVTGNSSIQ